MLHANLPAVVNTDLSDKCLGKPTYRIEVLKDGKMYGFKGAHKIVLLSCLCCLEPTKYIVALKRLEGLLIKFGMNIVTGLISSHYLLFPNLDVQNISFRRTDTSEKVFVIIYDIYFIYAYEIYHI